MKHGDKVKQMILDAGLILWANDPTSVSAREIGRKIKMTHANVLYHFPDDSLKDAIADQAVKTGNSRVIVQLMAIDHPAVNGMSVRERKKHVAMVNSK